MLMNSEEDQLTLFDLDTWCGKMFPEPSPAEIPRGRTSALSWKRLSELKHLAFQSLDLTPGAGNLLGEYYWELISPWRGDALMLNTGVSPREEKGSSLSQILQPDPPPKYFLSPKACQGILRRAFERGKELPPKLKRALEIQAGIAAPDGQPTSLLFGITDQREEDSADEMTEGFDGYNGDLTGSVSATLGTNCGMSTGRNGVVAFAANQRDEVRDLRDIAGALGSQPGMKQQTFVAAGFSEKQNGMTGKENSASVPSVLCLNDQGGERMDVTQDQTTTLRAQAGGHQPLICLNDQGGGIMNCTEDITGTLRAQEHGHQPLIYENHGIDSRYTGPLDVAPTMSARYGTGGNNVPLVADDDNAAICIVGNVIDRQPQNGGNGCGYQTELAYTLTATDHHAVFSRQRVDVFQENDVVSTESARQHKDATDLVYQDVVGSLTREDYKGSNSQYVGQDKCVLETPNLIRRLTPLECERLQGFPDGWTDLPGASDASRYKALGNSVAIPCVEYIMQGLALALRVG